MARANVVVLTETQGEQLEALARSRTMPHSMVRRAPQSRSSIDLRFTVLPDGTTTRARIVIAEDHR